MKISLCVGINEYADLPDSTLAGCVSDALNWKGALEARGFEVGSLIDGFALRSVILNALREYVGELKRDDKLVFTNSSHGTWTVDQDGDEADRRDEAICPHDVASAGPISDDELYEIFSAKAPGSKIIFISDSCHSGTLARFEPSLTPPGARVSKIRYMPPSVWLKPSDAQKVASRLIAAPFKSKSRIGALVMAGCMDDEYSFDAWIEDKPCGAYTYAALKALNELSARPNSSSSSSSVRPTTYLDWHRAIRKQLPSVDYPQTPQLDGTATQKRWPIFA